MATFTVHDASTAPDGARSQLAESQAAYGFVPTLRGVFAESPELLEAYKAIGEIFGRTAFTPAEQQVVLLAINYENGFDYCMAARTGIARAAGVAEADLEVLRSGGRLADPHLAAHVDLVRSVVQRAGWLTDEDVEAFLAAGWEKRQVLDVILATAYKTMSNYTNHVVRTPLDPAFVENAWSAPHAASA